MRVAGGLAGRRCRTLLVAVALGAGLAGCTAYLDPTSFLAGDGGAGADGGMDAGGDAGTCACSDPADVCVLASDGTPRCERTGADCAACPTGYACEDGAACACADPTVCGVECRTDLDCGTDRCDIVRGVCRPALGCLNYNACLDVCVDFRCVETGDVPPGGACRTSADCFDGLCRDGFCATVCYYNDDCAAGSVCAYEADSSVAACVPASGACVACTDPCGICTSDGECLEWCEEQLDCFDGDTCVLNAGGYACRPSTITCGESEVFLESAGACAQPLGCYTADDPACQDGYECRSEESLGISNESAIGFCVRL